MTMAMEVQKLQAQLMNGRAGIKTLLYSFILSRIFFLFSLVLKAVPVNQMKVALMVIITSMLKVTLLAIRMELVTMMRLMVTRFVSFSLQALFLTLSCTSLV